MILPAGKSKRGFATVTVAALLILLGGQLGPLIHEALVQHEVCAEHGERVHAGDPHAGDAGDASNVGITDVALVSISPTDRDGGADAHDHCQLDTAARESSAANSTVQHLVDVSPEAPRLGLATHDALVARLDYRLAPKTSPPA